jgi:hypothetical protein
MWDPESAFVPSEQQQHQTFRRVVAQVFHPLCLFPHRMAKIVERFFLHAIGGNW